MSRCRHNTASHSVLSRRAIPPPRQESGSKGSGFGTAFTTGRRWAATPIASPRHPVEPGADVPEEAMEIIEAMPVKSMITRPSTGIEVASGEALALGGHAWCGDGPVLRDARESRFRRDLDRSGDLHAKESLCMAALVGQNPLSDAGSLRGVGAGHRFMRVASSRWSCRDGILVAISITPCIASPCA